MKTNQNIIRMAALSALVTLGACNGYQHDAVQAPLSAYDPWETYKLGNVYDCQAIQANAGDMRYNEQNTPSTGFGCSHQSNITLMAAKPEDLTTPRAMTPADPRRTQRVYDAYGNGEDTTTARRAQGTQELIE